MARAVLFSLGLSLSDLGPWQRQQRGLLRWGLREPPNVRGQQLLCPPAPGARASASGDWCRPPGPTPAAPGPPSSQPPPTRLGPTVGPPGRLLLSLATPDRPMAVSDVRQGTVRGLCHHRKRRVIKTKWDGREGPEPQGSREPQSSPSSASSSQWALCACHGPTTLAPVPLVRGSGSCVSTGKCFAATRVSADGGQERSSGPNGGP